MSTLSLKNVAKYFAEAAVIPGLNLDIEEGEFTVLVGPSGCGKSTLLRMIAGLEEVSAGEILIDGKPANNLHPRERGVSMVFQSYALYPHMNVRDNIGFGLKLEGMEKVAIKRLVEEAAETLQITSLLARKPAELSGGQRQRVAIGRAIVRKPRFILFDEPLSNLDAKLRVEMRAELQKFHQSHGITTIYVTHDQVEAMTMADRIAVMNFGEIQQLDTPLALYSKPANLFVAGFIGSPQMNFLEVVGRTSDGLQLEGDVALKCQSQGNLALADCQKIGIRPEHIKLAKHIDGQLHAQIDVVENLGDETYIHLRMQTGQKLMVKCQGLGEFRVGQDLGLDFDLERVYYFNAQGKRLVG